MNSLSVVVLAAIGGVFYGCSSTEKEAARANVLGVQAHEGRLRALIKFVGLKTEIPLTSIEDMGSELFFPLLSLPAVVSGGELTIIGYVRNPRDGWITTRVKFAFEGGHVEEVKVAIRISDWKTSAGNR
jgi:hypothetical protein